MRNLVVIIILTLALPAAAEVVRYEIGEGSEIVFESKAPLDSFEGRTNAVHGWFEADLQSLGDSITVMVTVDLATFDTGIGKRNQHMRDNHLETDRFPQARFVGGAVEAVRTGEGALVANLRGELDLHGVTLPLGCEVTLRSSDDGSVMVTAGFVVKLSDHDIERPRFLVMKLADEQKVTVELFRNRPPFSCLH
jgi:polyisoprenoid-binding protein YceI